MKQEGVYLVFSQPHTNTHTFNFFEVPRNSVRIGALVPFLICGLAVNNSNGEWTHFKDSIVDLLYLFKGKIIGRVRI